MKKTILFIALLSVSFLSAQTWKSKRINTPVVNYAEYPSPQGITDYYVAVTNSEGAGLPFTEEELQTKTSFEEFELVEENAGPDLFFAVNGVKVSDLRIDVKRSQKEEMYYISILPKESAKIMLLVLANGENAHLEEFPVIARKDENDNAISETFDVPFAEIEKYLIISESGNQHKGTSFLVQEYLKEAMGATFLENRLIPHMQKAYDNHVAHTDITFYWIKDKKNKSIEADTKANLVLMEETLQPLNSLEKLRANKGELQPFKDFWTQQLTNYDLGSKDGKKAGWGILMNLQKIALLEEDFNASQGYIDQLIGLSYKKWVTGSAKSSHKDAIKGYGVNFDESGNRKYGTPYEVDPLLAKIAKNDAIKSNNFKDAPGYVVKKDGEKLEGKIALRFSPEAPSGGTVVSLDGDTTAKRVYVTYVNAKGKTRTASLKCKEVAEIVIDNRTFQSVNPKKSIIDGSDGALGLSLNNTVFMERIFSSDKVTLYKDLTTTTDFYFSFPNVKKAQKASAEVFAACPMLAERIGNGEFSQTDEDQKKIAEAYSNGCNAK